MRICIVAEGCYPYVVGGVSGWIHSLIKSFPNIEFVILSIVSNRSMRGKFAYELADNVTEVHELYLEDYDWCEEKNKKNRTKRISKKYYNALRSLIINENVQWDELFQMFRNKKLSIDDILMGPDFMEASTDCYRLHYPDIPYSDFLWTMRSLYLPLFFTLKMDLPKADVYHCVATGYAGVLGSMAKSLYGCKLIVSEHGIYTREREEELIKAKWVQGIYKNICIEQFRKMSQVAYMKADLVTSLYEHARSLQIELGCPKYKTRVTPNGIDMNRFVDIEHKHEEDKEYINIGAILRVTPIKDVKTMISAFGYAKAKKKNIKLWIMGPCEEDKQYADECFELVQNMNIEDIVFTGRINVVDYIGRMDMTILTSISEGQPLTILESYAASKPVIATDVGNCSGLIYGEDDNFGQAGILVHIMNIEEIAHAMVELASDEEKRKTMGYNGYRRVKSKYKIEDMKNTYKEIYKQCSDDLKLEWKNDRFIPAK